MNLQIAKKSISVDGVVEQMLSASVDGGYPWQTLRWYDHGIGAVRGQERVDVADLGRVSVFGGGLRYDTARDHLEVAEEDEELSQLPEDLWLHETTPGSSEWTAARSVFMRYVRGSNGRGQRWAQASKLMHLKRPGFFPVVDSRFWRTYAEIRKDLSRDTPLPHSWALVHEDLVANGAARDAAARREASPFGRLRRAIAERRDDDPDGKVDLLLGLTDLRLLDIATWVR